MNYTIIGQDGKKYGPASAEQIRQWISEGRAETRTPVFVEGTADWTFLGLRPEFAADISGAPPVITPPTGASFKKNNQMAIWGMICGILAWTLCCCCVPFNLVGLVLSIIALTQIHANPHTQEGRGFAIAGIALSATNLVWCMGLTLLNFTSNNVNVVWPMSQN
jgi:hypothetical protein